MKATPVFFTSILSSFNCPTIFIGPVGGWSGEALRSPDPQLHTPDRLGKQASEQASKQVSGELSAVAFPADCAAALI